MEAIIRFLFEIIEGIVSAVIEGFFDCVNAFISKERKTILDADFEKLSTVLDAKNKGFAVGDKSFSIMQSYNHMVTLGNSGSGKTSKSFNK